MSPATATHVQQVHPRASANAPVFVGCAMFADPATVGAMRRFVREVGQRQGLPPAVLDDLCLIVSEFVTNAVIHSGGQDVTLRLTFGWESLSVAVGDTGRWVRPRRPDDFRSAENGRGTALARALDSTLAAGRHHPASGGTVAWAQLTTGTARNSPTST